MDKKLKEIIKKYSNERYIDIEKIVRKYSIIIDYFDFNSINGIIIGNRIGINKNLSKDRQRFTIAHEFGHFILNEKGISKGPFASSETKEVNADQFAMEILLPTESFLKEWNKHKKIDTIANIFCVPENVVRNRLIKILF